MGERNENKKRETGSFFGPQRKEVEIDFQDRKHNSGDVIEQSLAQHMK